MHAPHQGQAAGRQQEASRWAVQLRVTAQSHGPYMETLQQVGEHLSLWTPLVKNLNWLHRTTALLYRFVPVGKPRRQVQVAMNTTGLRPAHLNGCSYLMKVAAVHRVVLMCICLLFCFRSVVLLLRSRPGRVTGTQQDIYPPGWHHETGTGAYWKHYLLDA
jgi:hypothetical protein